LQAIAILTGEPVTTAIQLVSEAAAAQNHREIEITEKKSFQIIYSRRHERTQPKACDTHYIPRRCIDALRIGLLSDRPEEHHPACRVHKFSTAFLTYDCVDVWAHYICMNSFQPKEFH